MLELLQLHARQLLSNSTSAHETRGVDSPWEPDWRSLVAIVLVVVVGSFANSAGVGGGAIFIPILQALVNFDLKTATAVSQALITAGSLVSVIINLFKRKPGDESKPLIDFHIAVALTPCVLVGVSVGVLLNVVFPPWLLTALLLLLILFLIFQSYIKGRALWRAETRRARTAAQARSGEQQGQQEEERGSDQLTRRLLDLEDEAFLSLDALEGGGGDAWYPAHPLAQHGYQPPTSGMQQQPGQGGGRGGVSIPRQQQQPQRGGGGPRAQQVARSWPRAGAQYSPRRFNVSYACMEGVPDEGIAAEEEAAAELEAEEVAELQGPQQAHAQRADALRWQIPAGTSGIGTISTKSAMPTFRASDRGMLGRPGARGMGAGGALPRVPMSAPSWGAPEAAAPSSWLQRRSRWRDRLDRALYVGGELGSVPQASGPLERALSTRLSLESAGSATGRSAGSRAAPRSLHVMAEGEEEGEGSGSGSDSEEGSSSAGSSESEHDLHHDDHHDDHHDGHEHDGHDHAHGHLHEGLSSLQHRLLPQSMSKPPVPKPPLPKARPPPSAFAPAAATAAGFWEPRRSMERRGSAPVIPHGQSLAATASDSVPGGYQPPEPAHAAMPPGVKLWRREKPVQAPLPKQDTEDILNRVEELFKTGWSGAAAPAPAPAPVSAAAAPGAAGTPQGPAASAGPGPSGGSVADGGDGAAAAHWGGTAQQAVGQPGPAAQQAAAAPAGPAAEPHQAQPVMPLLLGSAPSTASVSAQLAPALTQASSDQAHQAKQGLPEILTSAPSQQQLQHTSSHSVPPHHMQPSKVPGAAPPSAAHLRMSFDRMSDGSHTSHASRHLLDGIDVPERSRTGRSRSKHGGSSGHSHSHGHGHGHEHEHGQDHRKIKGGHRRHGRRVKQGLLWAVRRAGVPWGMLVRAVAHEMRQDLAIIPGKQALALLGTWIFFVVLQVSRSQVAKCSPAFWGLLATQLCVMLGISATMTLVESRISHKPDQGQQQQQEQQQREGDVERGGQQQQQQQVAQQQGGQQAGGAGGTGAGAGAGSNTDTQLGSTPASHLGILAVAVVAGLVGGLLGLGGGMVVAPLLLELGVQPQVGAATSTLMVLFSSSSALISFLVLDRLNYSYSAVLGAASVGASVLGVFLVGGLVRRTGRTSLVVFALSVVMLAGFGAVLGSALRDLDTLRSSRMHSICT